MSDEVAKLRTRLRSELEKTKGVQQQKQVVQPGADLSAATATLHQQVPFLRSSL